MAHRVSRGEIWTYECRKPDKLRPVLVVMRNATIEVSNTVLVAPVTSTIRDLPTEVRVGVDEGLKHPSAVKLDNLQCVDKTRLRRFVGSLGERQMKEVCVALGIATGCV
jgi:mRNA interferase MazF